MKKRFHRWKETKYFLTMLSGPPVEDNELSQLITEAQKSSNELKINIPKFNDVGIVEACEEPIFDIEEEKPIFYMILYAFDVESGLIKLENALKLFLTGTTQRMT